MKRILALSALLLMGLTVYATEKSTPVPQETRSPLFQNIDLPIKKSIFEKCLLAGKSLGAGAMSTIFGYCCYLNATQANMHSDSKESRLFDGIQAFCVATAAFVGAAKLGGYSLKNIKAVINE